MEHLGLFTVLCVMWWSSLFTLSLTLFRQKIKPHLKNIVISSLIMTQISIITQTKFPTIGFIVLQPGFTVLCFFLFFRLRLMHALLITLIIYMYTITSEMLLYVLVGRFHIETIIKLLKESKVLPGIFLSSLNLSITGILLKLRIGFTFISFNHKKRNTSNRLTKILFLLLAIGLIIMMLIISSVFFWETHIFLTFGLGTILLISLIHYLYVKELSDI